LAFALQMLDTRDGRWAEITQLGICFANAGSEYHVLAFAGQMLDTGAWLRLLSLAFAGQMLDGGEIGVF